MVTLKPLTQVTPMNTTTAERKQRLQDRRTAHHRALAALHATPATADGLKMWRALRKLEAIASSAAVAYCNGEPYKIFARNGYHTNYRFDQDGVAAWEDITAYLKPRIATVFGGSLPAGFFINGDPRGYALKIDSDTGLIPEGMHTDFGGYGILAPEIND